MIEAPKRNVSARWEITINGSPRTYRDRREIAIAAGEYLKSMNPYAEVTVRDLDGEEPVLVIKTQPPQVKR